MRVMGIVVITVYAALWLQRTACRVEHELKQGSRRPWRISLSLIAQMMALSLGILNFALEIDYLLIVLCKKIRAM